MRQVCQSPIPYSIHLASLFPHTSLGSLHLHLAPLLFNRYLIKCLLSQLDLTIFLKDDPFLLLCLEALCSLGIKFVRQLPGKRSNEEREVQYMTLSVKWRRKLCILGEGTHLVSKQEARRLPGYILWWPLSRKGIRSVPLRKMSKETFV